MADPFEPCTGHIWKDEPLEPECTCFKQKGPVFQVDGSHGDVLKFATNSTTGAGHKLMKFNAANAIAHNTQDLKLCRWKALSPLRSGIKTNCGDVVLTCRFFMTGTYPAEFSNTLVDWTIQYRKKYIDKEATVTFPFEDHYSFNQRSFPPNVHPDMSIDISNLTVTMNYTNPTPCYRLPGPWSASVSDNAATNDAGFQDPTTWDPSGTTYNNNSVHPDGHIGIDWRFYNTLVRFGEVTYGPTIAAEYLLDFTTGITPGQPYGFNTVSKFVSGPF